MRLSFNNGCALFSAHFTGISFHFGVKRDEQTVYKIRDGEAVSVDCDWIWGRATEPYDFCLEYFGLGPFLLVCWPP